MTKSFRFRMKAPPPKEKLGMLRTKNDIDEPPKWVFIETSFEYDPSHIKLANKVSAGKVKAGIERLRLDYYYGRITSNNLL